MRDEQLDVYRGFTMIYIVCVIHVMYWLHLGNEPFMSLALVEMPLIFFISGAAMAKSKSRRKILQTLWNRMKRVVFPFYIYALVSLVLLCFLTLIWNVFAEEISIVIGKEMMQKHSFNVLSYKCKDWVQILLCNDIPQMPYMWHTWFIAPYILLTCTLGVQLKVLEKIRWGGYFVLCIIAFLLSLLTDIELLRNVFAYNLFFMTGYLFYKKLTYEKIILLTFSVTFLFGCLVFFRWSVVPMQSHKFPPDVMFVTYNMVVICMLGLTFSKVKLPSNKLIDLWNKRGYTIFLYQNLIFFCVFTVHKVFVSRLGTMWLEAVLCSLFVLVGSTLLSFITCPIETYIMRKINELEYCIMDKR